MSTSENTPVNTTVLCENAADKDEGLYAQIHIPFSKYQKPALKLLKCLALFKKNGEIKTEKQFNFEAKRNYEIFIETEDGGGFVTHSKLLIEIIENKSSPKICITSITTLL